MRETPINILCIQLGDIGDVVISFPCFKALKDHFPQSRITVAVREKATSLMELSQEADEVVAFDRRGGSLWSLSQYYWHFFKKIRRKKYDLAIDLRLDSRGVILAFLSGAQKRVAFGIKNRDWLRNQFFTHLYPPNKDLHIHQIDYHLDLLQQMGIDDQVGATPRFVISEPKKKAAQELLCQEGIYATQRIIAIQPFSLRSYKELPEKLYIELISAIRNEYNLPVIITGSAAERDRAGSIVSKFKAGVFNLAGKTSLELYAAVLSQCFLFIGVDSAGQHIAAAAGTPTVSIYGPSRPDIWAPRGQNHLVVSKKLPCLPCSRKGCEDGGHSRCLATLTIEEIMAQISPLILESARN